MIVEFYFIPEFFTLSLCSSKSVEIQSKVNIIPSKREAIEKEHLCDCATMKMINLNFINCDDRNEEKQK